MAMTPTLPPGTRVRISSAGSSFRNQLGTVVPNSRRIDSPSSLVLVQLDDRTPTGTKDGLLAVAPESLEVVAAADPTPKQHRVYLAVELVVVDDDPKLHATLANLATTAVIDFLSAGKIVSSETTARMEVES